MLHDYIENICAMSFEKVAEEKERIFFHENSENRKRFWKKPEKLTKRQTKKQSSEVEAAILRLWPETVKESVSMENKKEAEADNTKE